MIFEQPDGCMDTIAIMIDCINPDTILADLVIGITDTICLDTSDLAGNIIDIDNICSDASGSSASINFLDGFTCIEVTGIEVGMDTACIVMCDDLGVCDTTTFIFNTMSDQVSPPTANPDTANTVINTPVDIVIVNNDDAGNLMIDTFYVIEGPDNGTNSLCVFNRWGNQVYRKDAYGYNESGQYDENTLWNGTWTNETLPDGTYFYLLDDGNGNKHSGYLQIHR